MSDIKIRPGINATKDIDAVKEVADSIESMDGAGRVSEIENITVDSIERIAADVAAGKTGRAEAVERILANVMQSKMVSDVPPSVKQELETMLTTLLEEDAHLRSLSAAIGPNEIE